jgi:BlaI family penicillinase repressor
MTDSTVKVTDAEMELLQLLWAASPLSATDIAQRIPAERGWQLPTVKTLLSRLAAKGAVHVATKGRRNLYSPAVEREAIAGQVVGRLLDRLFSGRVSPLVAQLAEDRDLTPEDLAELEALVRSLRK